MSKFIVSSMALKESQVVIYICNYSTYLGLEEWMHADHWLNYGTTN